MIIKPVGTLWLFSSDHRPLYVQDCFTVMAQPFGAVQRFRYQRKWVSLGAGLKVTDDAWEQLVGIDVVVSFVAARSKAYGRSVFVPLRRGTVVRAIAEGDFLIVDFSLGEYMSVAEVGDTTGDQRRNLVVAATDSLRARLAGRYPAADYGEGEEGGYSAVLDRNKLPRPKPDHAEATRTFTENALILDDLLADSGIARPVFMRFLGVRRTWPSRVARKKVRNGAYRLRAGTEYQADLLTFSTQSADGSVGLNLPSILVAATTPVLPLASTYDVSTFTFVSAPHESNNRGEIVAEVHGSGAEAKTTVRARVPVIVRPKLRFTFLNWIVVAGSIATAFIVTLLASKGLLWEPPTGTADYYVVVNLCHTMFVAYSPAAFWVAVSAAGAAGLAAAGAVFRRRYGLDSK